MDITATGIPGDQERLEGDVFGVGRLAGRMQQTQTLLRTSCP